MTAPVEATVFDFTGVVTSSPWPHIGALGAGDGIPPERVLEVIVGDYAVDTDHPWHRLERGEIDVGTYAEEVIVLMDDAGLDLDIAELAGLLGRLEVHDVVVETVRRLRGEGYRTALLTNNVAEAGAQWRRLVPLDELFEVVVDSSAVGLRKPDPAIYHLTLQRLGVEPARAVMLDDHPGNIAGARAAGMHALLVDDPEAAMAALTEFLAERGPG